jgi:hypothetical protein
VIFVTYLIDSIKEITCNKIIYCKNGIEDEIDLHECCRNWVSYASTSNDFATGEGNLAPRATLKESRCVGERNWLAERPYFEFFADTKIRFEIQPKKTIFGIIGKKRHCRHKYYVQFSKVSMALEKAGWCTFDLS